MSGQERSEGVTRLEDGQGWRAPLLPSTNVSSSMSSSGSTSTAHTGAISTPQQSLTPRSTPLLFDLTLVSPWFELTRDGQKTLEGRINRKPVSNLQSGDAIRMTDAKKVGQGAFFLRVKGVYAFASFEEGLRSERINLKCALPTVNTVGEGVDIYKQFYSIEQQRQFGIRFIEVERIDGNEVESMPRVLRKISLWIQPAAGSKLESDLSTCIADLSARHKQMPFPPHITLASLRWPHDSPITMKHIAARIRESVTHVSVAAGIADPNDPVGSLPMRLACDALATHPTNPFMTLVVLMQRHPLLMLLRQKIFDHVIQPIRDAVRDTDAIDKEDEDSWPAAWPFVPHISLLYDVRGCLSPLNRESALENDVRWQERIGRSSFIGSEMDMGVINVVSTETDEYHKQWKVVATVPLNRDNITSTTIRSMPFPPPASIQPHPLHGWSGYCKYVQSMNHQPFLRLALERAGHAQEHDEGGRLVSCGGCALVYDGMVVMSTGSKVATDQDCTKHSIMRLLQEWAALCRTTATTLSTAPATSTSTTSSSTSTSTSSSIPFFIPPRLERMQLYTSNEPCPMCASAIALSGIRAVIFAVSMQRMWCLLPASPFPSAQTILSTCRPPILSIGPIDEDESINHLRSSR